MLFGDSGMNVDFRAGPSKRPVRPVPSMGSEASPAVRASASRRRRVGDEPAMIRWPTVQATWPTVVKTAMSVIVRLMSMVEALVRDVDDLADDQRADGLHDRGADHHLDAQRLSEHQLAVFLVD